jgi:hypothetical protein
LVNILIEFLLKITLKLLFFKKICSSLLSINYPENYKNEKTKEYWQLVIYVNMNFTSQFLMTLQKLYKLGGRRVLVTGTGPMGCVPAELAMRNTNGGCSAELQRAASLFNPQLLQMLRGINNKIGKDVFIAANTQRMHRDFISNPQAFGMLIYLASFSTYLFICNIFKSTSLNFYYFLF